MYPYLQRLEAVKSSKLKTDAEYSLIVGKIESVSLKDLVLYRSV